MRKVFYTLIGFLGIILITSGLFLWKSWSIQNDLVKIIKNENINNLTENSFLSKKIIDRKNQTYYYFAPTAINKDFYHENLPSSVYKSTQKDQYVFLKPEFSTTDLKGVKNVKIHKIVYEAGFLKLKRVSDHVVSDYHIKTDYQTFHLSELVSGHLDDITRIVTKDYPDQKFEISDYSQISEENGILRDHFKVKDKILIIDKTIQVPLQELFDVIDSNFLTGQSKIDFTEYQKAKEAALHPKKLVALTFDDGPNPLTSPLVISILQKYNAKATFFMMGSKVLGNESILKSVIASGSEIGNHTWDHPYLTKQSDEEVKSQIERTNIAIEKACGKRPIYLRPPYGATNARVEKLSGMTEILWTVDTRDWENHNTEKIIANIKSQLHPGGIILMHDIHQTSLQALPTVLDYLKKEGYQCVTVSKLLGDN